MSSVDELWIIGEFHGPFRGQMAKHVRGWPAELDFVQVLASVGSSGYWPHCVAFWRASPDRWTAQLQRGLVDDFDEEQIWWGETRVCRAVRGQLPDAGAFLIERVLATGALGEPGGLDGLEGPDVVYAEVFAPHNGYAIWGASDFRSLGGLEQNGIGVTDKVADRLAWWATVVPEREMV